ncbi:MAG TPA: DUF4382 domain-containing protein [Steroidobacteraceae bacterium]|nr:DUF4382 domain-containing protein [Steroidobacteraceae bacterium]
MTSITRSMSLAALVLATAALGACGGGSDSSGSGALSINLADTPVDNATEVVVDFTGIELHNTNGTMVTIKFPSAKQIDLLKLQNGVTGALTQGESVPAGSYDWMRLDVLANKDTQGESYITLNTGAQYPLYIPSGAQTGLKLVTPFKVAQGSTTQLIIDFNLRQSVTSAAGQNYILVPALRLEDQLQVGTIAADIDLAALTTQQLGSGTQVSQCKGGLFLFSGATATPQNGGGADLVVFEPIPYDGTTTQVSLSIPYVATGSYTLAATCNYDLYDPAAVLGQSGYQTLHWTVLDNVSVTANATTSVTLPSSSTSNIVN